MGEYDAAFERIYLNYIEDKGMENKLDMRSIDSFFEKIPDFEEKEMPLKFRILLAKWLSIEKPRLTKIVNEAERGEAFAFILRREAALDACPKRIAKIKDKAKIKEIYTRKHNLDESVDYSKELTPEQVLKIAQLPDRIKRIYYSERETSAGEAGYRVRYGNKTYTGSSFKKYKLS